MQAVSDVECILRERAEAFGIAGLAAAIITPDGDRLITYGVDSAQSRRAVSNSTWFSLASTGKHVTSCMILDLARQGRLQLDDKVGEHLSDTPPTWSDRSIRSLMRHTSGLPEYLSYTEFDCPPTLRTDFMHVYRDLEPVFEQDAAWMYSNTNYILLGFLIAQLAGFSYADTAQTLFARAGCTGVTTASPAWARAANETGLGQDATDTDSWAREVIGDGDISATVEGAACWTRTLLRNRIFERAKTPEMFAPATLLSGLQIPYGCGWFVERLGDNVIAYHSGHYDGWTAMTLLAPHSASGVTVMSNFAPGNTRAVRYLAQLALETAAPGATPLASPTLIDTEPSLSGLAHEQLFREDSSPNLAHFAPALRQVIERGGIRGLINLWAGTAPTGFSLVGEQHHKQGLMRRYRATYPDRVEHVLVGFTQKRQIYWAWPL